MVKYFAILIFSLAALYPSISEAKEPKGLSLTIAAGNNFAFPASFRVGWNEWEYGMLNGRSLGASKLFFFSESFYTNLGLGLIDSMVGVTAGVGAWIEMFWGVAFRVEISANSNYSGVMVEQGILGLSIDF